MNKQFSGDTDYDEVYTKLSENTAMLARNPTKRRLTYDWREFSTNVDLPRHSVSKAKKYKSKIKK